MIKFEFTEKDGKQDYDAAKLPVYSTKSAACCDFFCAEHTVIPPMNQNGFKPTLVHTGVKASYPDDVVLRLYTRSSIPKKGLILANSVGIIDADYYGNESNDGEIMFAYFNLSDEDVVFEIGDKIGQGEFCKFLRADNADESDEVRSGGFGSTDK